MDILEDNAVVPTYQGGIFIKATRLPTYTTASESSPIATVNVPSATRQRAESTSKPVAIPQPPSVTKPHPPPKPTKSVPQHQESLLNFHDEEPATPTTAHTPNPTSHTTNVPISQQQQTQSSPFFEEDLLGFNSSTPTVPASSSSAQVIILPLSPSITLYIFLLMVI